MREETPEGADGGGGHSSHGVTIDLKTHAKYFLHSNPSAPSFAFRFSVSFNENEHGEGDKPNDPILWWVRVRAPFCKFALFHNMINLPIEIRTTGLFCFFVHTISMNSNDGVYFHSMSFERGH